MRIVLILAAGAVMLSACGRDPVTFDGVNYRRSVKAPRDNNQSFVTSVRPVSAGFEGARAAAEYEGTRYCITLIGRSDIAWTIGPDSEAGAIPIDGDTLSYQGRCIE